VLERDEYTKRKEALLTEEQDLEAKLEGASQEESPRERAERILELAGSPKESHERQNQERGRALLQILTSNRSVAGNEVALELDLPFSLLVSEPKRAGCGPRLSKPRRRQTLPELDAVAKKLCRWLLENPTSFNESDPIWQKLKE
jgi:hypothetical protein